MTDRYAVIGHPVAHSRSPQIHATFARQTAQDISYERLLAPLDQFVATVKQFREQGGRGSNVTLPFKLEAFALADEFSERARDAGAANTLMFRADGIFADNTDGAGLLADIVNNLGVSLTGARILLLGAGGAAQGVFMPLLSQSPAILHIANRTQARTAAMLEKFAPQIRLTHAHVTSSDFAQLNDSEFDLVVNATSSSLSDELPPLPTGLFGQSSLAYDMMYGKGLSPFLRFAQSQGAARIADGLGMLVEQAAESFYLWRGVRPRSQPVIAALRNA